MFVEVVRYIADAPALFGLDWMGSEVNNIMEKEHISDGQEEGANGRTIPSQTDLYSITE